MDKHTTECFDEFDNYHNNDGDDNPLYTFDGHIHIYTGCMFSGKSSKLMSIINQYSLVDEKIVVINYIKDCRYSEGVIATHDGATHGAIRVATLSQINLDDVILHNVIVVDEAQFYPDLCKYAEKWANMGKKVYVGGLDGTFQRDLFGQVAMLLPKAEKVTKFHAVCHCKQEAAFSERLTTETDVELIGGKEQYNAVCRKCYFLHKKTKIRAVASVVVAATTTPIIDVNAIPKKEN
jgi:thymidine kinase